MCVCVCKDVIAFYKAAEKVLKIHLEKKVMIFLIAFFK